ncbi:hypothetical protein K443DRAFT_103712, partial [Laccaria amethystina LaAM-08-1]
IKFVISPSFDPFISHPLAFFISEFLSLPPFQQPLIHLIPFITHPTTHLSPYDNLPNSEFLLCL